jgi:hypothetical protein
MRNPRSLTVVSRPAASEGVVATAGCASMHSLQRLTSRCNQRCCRERRRGSLGRLVGLSRIGPVSPAGGRTGESRAFLVQVAVAEVTECCPTPFLIRLCNSRDRLAAFVAADYVAKLKY